MKYILTLILINLIYLINSCSYEWTEGGTPKLYSNKTSGNSGNLGNSSNSNNQFNKFINKPILNGNTEVNIGDENINDEVLCKFLTSDEVGFKEVAQYEIDYLCSNNYAGLKELRLKYNFVDGVNSNVKNIDKWEKVEGYSVPLSYLDVFYANQINHTNIIALEKLTQYYCQNNGNRYWELTGKDPSLDSFITYNVSANSCNYELIGKEVGKPELGLSWKFHYVGYVNFIVNKAKTIFAEVNYLTETKPGGVAIYLMNFTLASQHKDYVQLYSIKRHIAELSAYFIVHNEAKKVLLNGILISINTKANALKKLYLEQKD